MQVVTEWKHKRTRPKTPVVRLPWHQKPVPKCASWEDMSREWYAAMGYREQQPTIRSILKLVADYYGVTVMDLLSSRRHQRIVRARQVAMYLSITHTTCSLPQCGKYMGGKDHTTVMHGVRKIKRLLETSEQLQRDIDALNCTIEGTA